MKDRSATFVGFILFRRPTRVFVVVASLFFFCFPPLCGTRVAFWDALASGLTGNPRGSHTSSPSTLLRLRKQTIKIEVKPQEARNGSEKGGRGLRGGQVVHDGVVFKGPSVLPPIEKWHNGMGKFSMHKNGMGVFLVCLFPALKMYVHALRRER